MDDKCISCRKEAAPGTELREFFMYFSPFDTEEQGTGFFYCDACYEDGSADVDTFYCDGCSRTISESNGAHGHYRLIGGCELVCLRCIDKTLKREGIAGFPDELDELFTGGVLFGMFFNVGELEAEGWIGAPGYTNTFVKGREQAKALAYMAQSLDEGGRMIIIGYERLSIVGDEGYVTLFSKEQEGG